MLPPISAPISAAACCRGDALGHHHLGGDAGKPLNFRGHRLPGSQLNQAVVLLGDGDFAVLLLQQDGTVTVCHSKTPGLAAITREADILVSAVGRVGLVTPGMVKEGAVVIDVAMNRNSEGRLCGDVDFAAVEPKASYITPVPGGVGPMTRAMLMRNILTAARNHQAEK